MRPCTVYTLLTLLIGCISGLKAQTLDDALRYSEVAELSTARGLALGNSMSAIGAEWSAVAANPAGLAAYRRNEFSISIAGVQASSRDISLDGNALGSGDPYSRFALPQVALVFTREPIGSRWTQFNFAVGISQRSRLEESLALTGSTVGSISDWFLETSNNFYEGNPFPPNELLNFTEGTAFDAGIIRNFIPSDPFVTENALYTSDYDQQRLLNGEAGAADPLLSRTIDIQTRGYNSSIDFSFGGNFDEKLMIGATFALARSSFTTTNSYSENDAQDNIIRFERLSFNQRQSAEGTGFLGRVGLIYRVSQSFRLGAAYHSPTINRIQDSYNTTASYLYRNEQGTGVQGQSPQQDASVIDFTFFSPGQVRGSAALFLQKRGFISAELGYINYRGGRFSLGSDIDPNGANERNLNDLIDADLQGAIQIRVGAEANLQPFQVRVGYQSLGAPVQGEDASQVLSAGLGFRKNRMAVDLGGQMIMRPNRLYRPYTVQLTDFPQPFVEYSPRVLTLGLTFSYKLSEL